MAKGSFGELLKRELREISLNELTVATRVAPKFLEALENGRQAPRRCFQSRIRARHCSLSRSERGAVPR